MLNRTTPPEPDWVKYRLYLEQNFAAKTVYDRLTYAKRYCSVLYTQDARDLLTLSPDKQKHAMKALAVLSKYLGCYETWLAIKRGYQLKWAGKDSLEVFNDIVNGEGNYTAMKTWLKQAMDVLPETYRHALTYNVLTGLRPTEALHSITLVQTDSAKYLKGDTLEHFRYPNLFLRRTKKAYISIVDRDVLAHAKAAGKHTYASIRMALDERGLATNMKYCRRMYSTHLRMAGIESELVDLMQGRLPQSVFVRSYFRPDWPAQKERIEKAILSLQDKVA